MEKLAKQNLLTLFVALSVLIPFASQAQTLLEWNFFGFSNQVTALSTVTANEVNPSTLSRGSGASASSANNSFRTTGFGNNGISLTNTDYFQFSLLVRTNIVPAPTISLSKIDMRLAGTATFSANTGVTNAWAYSLDGGANYNLLSTFQQVGNSTNAVSFDLSGVSALQNVTSTNQIFFRYYASGQTTTGGWGFISPSSASSDSGLVLYGVVPEPSSSILMVLGFAVLVGIRALRRN